MLIAEDGKSAIAIEQFYFKMFSPSMAMRIIYHAVKSGENWKLDFVSWNFIPLNEDIGKINNALK